jgi:catechol 2,3-dioxygenase-like lactoylglutathione lyase family enzyme
VIDHISLHVSDYAKSIAFYKKALAPIGYTLLMDFPASMTKTTDVAGFGENNKPDFWIVNGDAQKPPLHVAFQVQNKELVEAFYAAALAAGGRDNGAPGPRPHYHPGYYGAFVLDLEGNNIEAVCHK